MSERAAFSRLRAALPALTLEQAKQLQAELRTVIKALEAAPIPESLTHNNREVVKSRRIGDRLYQFERVRCGKIGCKCAAGKSEMHGPYWYAYWRENDKLKSKYIGKKLNPAKGTSAKRK